MLGVERFRRKCFSLPNKGGQGGCNRTTLKMLIFTPMKILYHPKLKEYARKMRNNPTRAEAELWRHLKGDQTGYDFHRQKPIGYYIANFFCHDLYLVIEVDGGSHELLTVQYKDSKKEEYLNGMNLTVMRFTDDEVLNDTDTVLKTIKNYIEEFKRKG